MAKGKRVYKCSKVWRLIITWQRKLGILIVLISVVLISGCASGPTYQERVAMMPVPQTQEQLAQDCAWIRSEIARMQSLAVASATSQFALAFQAQARNNVASLESRAANIGCHAAFSSQNNQDLPETTSIQQCINACKENTNRTSRRALMCVINRKLDPPVQ